MVRLEGDAGINSSNDNDDNNNAPTPCRGTGALVYITSRRAGHSRFNRRRSVHVTLLARLFPTGTKLTKNERLQFQPQPLQLPARCSRHLILLIPKHCASRVKITAVAAHHKHTSSARIRTPRLMDTSVGSSQPDCPPRNPRSALSSTNTLYTK